ncbi:7677_t:CDS:1 [Paraglomus occultum]|uniref:RNA helicase n=1 Tax=Paraglomus occultum TaxID=144539 RepID=A0A9N8ZSP6_9GLOM|nr:7677_t:CDS:1 [Paraglomus occultum]
MRFTNGDHRVEKSMNGVVGGIQEIYRISSMFVPRALKRPNSGPASAAKRANTAAGRLNNTIFDGPKTGKDECIENNNNNVATTKAETSEGESEKSGLITEHTEGNSINASYSPAEKDDLTDKKDISVDATVHQHQRSLAIGASLQTVPTYPSSQPSVPQPLLIPSDLFHPQLIQYTPHAEIASLSPTQLTAILTKYGITANGRNIPRPILSFTHCEFPPKLHDNLQRAGYDQPTPVQMQAIPAGLAGRDILASSSTSSGKTASFLIPLIVHTWALSQFYNGKGGPYALIMAPTRELCSQIETQTKQMISGLALMRTALLVGGLPLPNQAYRLKQGAQIAVATPGRLLEIIRQCEEIDMSNIHMIVLDEVDMMLKMGFEEQVMEIIESLSVPENSTRRQIFMFSATMPKNIQSLANKILRDPITISAGHFLETQIDRDIADKSNNLSAKVITIPEIPVKQTILWVENSSKKKQLFSLFNDSKYWRPPIIVYVESKLGADLLAGAIEKKCGASVASIHSDKDQEERSRILDAFVNGEYEVLVATGVLSRGLNLDVRMIVLFDMAVSVEEYVHQVGRAAKYGNQGWAVTFINEDSKHLFNQFVSILKKQPFGRVTPLPSKLLNHGYTLYGKGR